LPQPLLWPSSQAANIRITVRDTPNLLNYCVIFTAYTKFTTVTEGRMIQRGGPRIGHTWSTIFKSSVRTTQKTAPLPSLQRPSA